MIAQQPPQQANMQQMYVPQMNNPNNQRQVPVRLSSVNFEGVFTSSRLNMESLISQNLYNNNANTQGPSNVIPQPPRAPNQPNTKGTPQQGSQPRKWLISLSTFMAQ